MGLRRGDQTCTYWSWGTLNGSKTCAFLVWDEQGNERGEDGLMQKNKKETGNGMGSKIVREYGGKMPTSCMEQWGWNVGNFPGPIIGQRDPLVKSKPFKTYSNRSWPIIQLMVCIPWDYNTSIRVSLASWKHVWYV